MKFRLVLAAALALLVPAAAQAAGPADVSVRIEGDTATVLPRTALHTTTTPVVKDGNSSHSCTGTSVAGALELATGGDWSGHWDDSFKYAVEVIKGESHVFGSGEYWSEYVNDKPGNGICFDELAQGDRVLFAPQPEAGGGPNPMELTAPPTAQRGAPFNVTVTEYVTTYDSSPPYAAHFSSHPVAGAAVGGATTDASGVAAVTLDQAGTFHLRATHSGNIRTATETVCVHDGDDGTCGTTKPGEPPAAAPPPAPPCVHDGEDGRCGTPDHKATYGFVKGVAEQQRFARGKGPRELRGTADADPSGIALVEARLTRRSGPRCWTFDGARTAFHRLKRCGADRGAWFKVGEAADWTYLLPAALGSGRYVLDLRVTDKAGNVDDRLARGRNRVVFFVG